MEGARRDLAGRCRSVDDIRALLHGANLPNPVARRPLLVEESHDPNGKPFGDAKGSSKTQEMFVKGYRAD